MRPGVIKALELEDAQVARIKEIAAKYEQPIGNAEQAARMTPEQTAAREAATKQAIACGMRGIRARYLIASQGRPTREQIDATRELIRLQNEREQLVNAVLGDNQRARIESGQVELNDEYTGFIVVRLVSSLPVDFEDSQTLNDVATKQKLTGLSRVLDTYRLTKSYRVMRGISENDFPFMTPASAALFRRLESYWRIDARDVEARAKVIVGELRDLPEIDVAYRELSTSDPGVSLANNPFNSHQGYLDAAPQGINARFAWTQPNGRGAGIGLADVEHCWNPYHEDLIGQSPQLIYGTIDFGDHGTAAVGVIAAEDNSVGVIGVAPAIDYLFLSSKIESGGLHIPEAICHVLPLMNVGDILNLEVETEDTELPIEIQDLEFDAIRFATSLGIIVIEAAGNGSTNLDELRVDGKRILNCADPCFRDSGAIFVGAGESEEFHNRLVWSNYGSRVNCYAWGHLVVAPGTISGSPDLSNGGGDPNKKYTTNFNGTSSAAPIVAGAAIILQGMAKANSGYLLSPEQMRCCLANRATGTPQGPRVSGNIGVMPDLKAIIEANPVFRCAPAPCRSIRTRRHAGWKRHSWLSP